MRAALGVTSASVRRASLKSKELIHFISYLYEDKARLEETSSPISIVQAFFCMNKCMAETLNGFVTAIS
jgi:hypothetical protein